MVAKIFGFSSNTIFIVILVKFGQFCDGSDSSLAITQSQGNPGTSHDEPKDHLVNKTQILEPSAVGSNLPTISTEFEETFFGTNSDNHPFPTEMPDTTSKLSVDSCISKLLEFSIKSIALKFDAVIYGCRTMKSSECKRLRRKLQSETNYSLIQLQRSLPTCTILLSEISSILNEQTSNGQWEDNEDCVSGKLFSMRAGISARFDRTRKQCTKYGTNFCVMLLQNLRWEIAELLQEFRDGIKTECEIPL